MKTYQRIPINSIMTKDIALFTISLFVALFPLEINAQWNMNTSENLQISGLSTSDMQSVTTSDGKTWIAFYHQNAGNYDMRAQLLDVNGNKLLGTDGMLVSNQPSGTTLYDFNICVDTENNLIIGSQDMRSGNLQAVLYKISQTGSQLWGASGIVLGPGYSPYPRHVDFAYFAVVWNDSNTGYIKLVILNEDGEYAQVGPGNIIVGSYGTTRGQIIHNTVGFTLLLQDISAGTSTTLYAQRFTDDIGFYAPAYDIAQLSDQITSSDRYYSLVADGDTTYVGYDCSYNSRLNSFVQRIDPYGYLPWGMNGSNFNTSVAPGDNFQGDTKINLTAGSDYVWSVCNFSNTAQSQYGVYIQKFLKTTGARQFTDGAKVIYAISASKDQQIGNLGLANDTPIFMTFDATYKIYATRLDAQGNFVWQGNRVELSSTSGSPSVPKMSFGFNTDGSSRYAGIWTENRGADYMGYAQDISTGGLIGLEVSTQGNVPATIPNNNGTLQLVANIIPASANQNETWTIIPVTATASISSSGLLTGLTNGTVWAKATAVQDANVSDSLMITITGEILAPGTSTLAGTNILQDAATLNGSVIANNLSTTVSFDWGLTSSYGNNMAATPSMISGYSFTNVLANLTGLNANTIYHYRCKGVNSMGTTYGSDMTFFTGCDALVAATGITGPADVCYLDDGDVYSISAIPDAISYTWTVPPGTTILNGQNTTSITVNFGTNSGNISVFGTSFCGSSSNPTNLSVLVEPHPVPTITGSDEICANTDGTSYFYTTETGMINYDWSISSGGTIISGAGTNMIEVMWSVPGDQSVTVSYSTSGGCIAASPTTLAVTVSSIPLAAGIISGTADLCAGATGIAYSVSPIANANQYIWSLPAGAVIVSGAFSDSIIVDFVSGSPSEFISVSGNNICGNGPSSPPFAIAVNPIPPTPTVIQDGSELTSNAPEGNQWYYSDNTDGPYTLIPGATGQVYTNMETGYYGDIVTLTGCSSSMSNVIYVLTEGISSVSAPAVNIYPDPNDGFFKISINSPSPDRYSLAVINDLGANVYAEQNLEVKSSYNQDIDLRTSGPGIYTLIIQNSQNRIVRKILVSR